MHGPLGAVYASSGGIRDYFTRTNEINVDRLGVLPIYMLMNEIPFLEWF